VIGPWTPTSSFGGTVSGDWKVALFRSGSNLSTSSTTYAGVTDEHPAEYGYVTGGVEVELDDDGDAIRLATVPEFTATSGLYTVRGKIVARYAALYQVGGDVAAFCLLDTTPADVTVLAGQTLRITEPDVFTRA
jgi:hypothetical protein